jgi:hypothetical protein
VLIDIDKLPLPAGLDFIKAPSAVVEHFVQRLPEEFHDASYHYQLSSSAGFRSPGLASAHVWFWLEPPLNDSELKRWAKAVNDKARCKLVDTALFNDVQPHYTAAPLFDGVPDPFPERSGLVRKSTPAVRLRVPKESPRSRRDRQGASVEQSMGFELLVAKIGDHPGGSGFHEAIIKATASYVAQHGRAGTDREALYERVRARVLEADRSQHDREYVEEMASREHIMAAIDGALEKYGDRPESRRRSKLVPGLAAEDRAPSVPSSEAHRQLSDLLDELLAP